MDKLKVLLLSAFIFLALVAAVFGQSIQTITAGQTVTGSSTTMYQFIINQSSSVTISLTMDSTVDYDLYVRWDGNQPSTSDTPSDTVCRPYLGLGQPETCSKTLQPGTYYILVNKYSGSGNFALSLLATGVTTLSSGACGSTNNPCTLSCGQTQRGPPINATGSFYYKISGTPPASATITMTPDSTADWDLYQKSGTPPTLTDYSCRPYLGTGTTETCTASIGASFTTYAMVNYYSGSGGYTISAQCTSTFPSTTSTSTSSSQGTTAGPALNLYPSFLITYSFYLIPTDHPLLVVGSNDNVADVLSATEIALGLPIISTTDVAVNLPSLVKSQLTKLDSEITVENKAKALILVGGPCVNSLVQQLALAGKFPYTCSTWPSENFGLIYAINNAFTNGKAVLVLAGTTPADTRLAGLVLQAWRIYLPSINSYAVKVTMSTTGSPVITPL